LPHVEQFLLGKRLAAVLALLALGILAPGVRSGNRPRRTEVVLQPMLRSA
jgi:hypothetical protein